MAAPLGPSPLHPLVLFIFFFSGFALKILLDLIYSVHAILFAIMSEEEMRAGWAIRRWRPVSQECPSGEFGDKTWGDWFGCCPEETSANKTGGNTQCDRGKIMGDSTPKDQCANSTWTLWYHKGYFCCDSEGDDRGYFYPDDSVGCANNSWINDATSDVSRAGSRPNPPPGMYQSNFYVSASG